MTAPVVPLLSSRSCVYSGRRLLLPRPPLPLLRAPPLLRPELPALRAPPLLPFGTEARGANLLLRRWVLGRDEPVREIASRTALDDSRLGALARGAPWRVLVTASRTAPPSRDGRSVGGRSVTDRVDVLACDAVLLLFVVAPVPPLRVPRGFHVPLATRSVNRFSLVCPGDGVR